MIIASNVQKKHATIVLRYAQLLVNILPPNVQKETKI